MLRRSCLVASLFCRWTSLLEKSFKKVEFRFPNVMCQLSGRAKFHRRFVFRLVGRPFGQPFRVGISGPGKIRPVIG